MTQDIINRYDYIINNENIAAIVMRQQLKPVEGDTAVIFPPTYAEIGYNIDKFGQGGGEITNVCTIDSVGSQANRMEPIFKNPPLCELVPRITIEIRKPPTKDQEQGELIETIDMLDAGHRVADAVVRFSSGGDEIQAAFQEVKKGNAVSLAKLDPTSLVFGCWDSRGTSVKIPRIIRSQITAYNVHQLKRSAQFIPATERYAECFEKLSDNERKRFADVGMAHVPSIGSPGGVLVDSNSRVLKDMVLSLSALRSLHAENFDATTTLRRYIFGLSLIAATAPQDPLLRMGCELTADPQKPAKWEQVNCDGTRSPIAFSYEDTLAFAVAAGADFGIGESKNFIFDRKKAREALKKKGKSEEE